MKFDKLSPFASSEAYLIDMKNNRVDITSGFHSTKSMLRYPGSDVKDFPEIFFNSVMKSHTEKKDLTQKIHSVSKTNLSPFFRFACSLVAFLQNTCNSSEALNFSFCSHVSHCAQLPRKEFDHATRSVPKSPHELLEHLLMTPIGKLSRFQLDQSTKPSFSRSTSRTAKLRSCEALRRGLSTTSNAFHYKGFDATPFNRRLNFNTFRLLHLQVTSQDLWQKLSARQ